MNIFTELSLILAVVVLVAGLAKLLRQPLIVSYIFTGILAGPFFFDLIKSSDALDIFSRMGIVLLLFTVGLGLNPKVIKYVGKISVITGLGQVLFTSLFGFLLAMWLGFSVITALYIAIALTFSSTIIIMKLLSDKGDIETLYGKISIGFLLIQDIVVVIVLMLITSLNGEMSIGTSLLMFLFKGSLFIGGVVLVGVYILPVVEKLIARSQELLLLFAIGWCFGLATLAHYMGFSMGHSHFRGISKNRI